MICLKNINLAYDDTPIFEDFNLSLNHNEISGILGASGIGKTTLINIIAGITPVQKGTVHGLDHQELSYIFQEPRLLPTETVYDNLSFVLHKHYPDPRKRREVILRNLDLVGLLDALNRYPFELSGGMKQRLSIARAFAFPSRVLIMDEPFKGLDVKLKSTVMEAFKRSYQAMHKTVVFVTHDLDEVLDLSDRVFVLGSRPAKVLATEVILREPGHRTPLENMDKKRASLLKSLL
ncbi:MAG: hypothetical protein AVO33_09555 [delta proteobacterium ML8_F1]|nr:MAG: hypothetical protein AVO33_09555 [delta proteobacterium ML8_F1]